MEKEAYFPRKKFFEDVQDLVATFYSTGSYLTDQISSYDSMLSGTGEADEFYYALYLLSALSHTGIIIKTVDGIIKTIRLSRIRRRITSTEDFTGEIDVEEYITKNHIEKAVPKEYPSTVQYSTFQLPEYQLTLFILKRCLELYRAVFRALGRHETVTAFQRARKSSGRLQAQSFTLQKKFGVACGHRDSYLSLKKKVMYRYRNRKILTGSYRSLMDAYERLIFFQGIDFDCRESLELFDHCEAFDDRLFEIWLIRQSVQLLSVKMGLQASDIEYLPLFRARRENKCVSKLENSSCRIEVLFQNRKKFMPKEELKWYWNDNGRREELGAVPDLIFLKYAPGSERPEQIVLVDAKNRRWIFQEDMSHIRGEIIQQIYIHDNFSSLFEDTFRSILVAHNPQRYQSRKYHHKDKPGYEIDVVSLNLSETELVPSLEEYANDLSGYLEL